MKTEQKFIGPLITLLEITTRSFFVHAMYTADVLKFYEIFFDLL